MIIYVQMSEEVAMANHKKRGPKSRNLTIRKTVLLSPAHSKKLDRLVEKYGTEGAAVRAALDALFLADVVSDTNPPCVSSALQAA